MEKVIIDDKLFENLKQMLISHDPESHEVAFACINNCNISKSLPYILVLMYIKDQAVANSEEDNIDDMVDWEDVMPKVANVFYKKYSVKDLTYSIDINDLVFFYRKIRWPKSMETLLEKYILDEINDCIDIRLDSILNNIGIKVKLKK